MDEIYQKHYGPELISYGCRKESGADWDVHRWSVGVAHACLRYAIRQMPTDKTAVVVTGKYSHQHGTRQKSLKQCILESRHLGGVETWEVTNLGRVVIKKTGLEEYSQ
eukprot:UN16172